MVFHKPSKKDDIPLVLSKLNLNNRETVWIESLNFLGVLLDENLSWKTYKIHRKKDFKKYWYII